MSSQYFLGDFSWNFLSLLRATRKGQLLTHLPKKENPLFYYFSFILLSVLRSSKENTIKHLLFKTKFPSFFPTDPVEEERRGKKKKKTHINNKSDAQSLQISHTAFEVIFYFFIFWVGFFLFLFFLTCCFFFFGSLTSSFLKNVLRRLRRRQFKKFALILSKQKKDSFRCLCKLQSFEQKVLQ